MRKGGSKGKGSGFEREIAKAIILAFKDFGVTQRDCWRSVLSGGHSMSSGDLEMTPKMEELFPWSVECKFRKEIRWENFLLGNPKSEEMKWVDQVLEGTKKRTNLYPLLVLKANHCKTLVVREIKTEEIKPYLTMAGKYWVVQPWTEFLKEAVLGAKKNHDKT